MLPPISPHNECEKLGQCSVEQRRLREEITEVYNSERKKEIQILQGGLELVSSTRPKTELKLRNKVPMVDRAVSGNKNIFKKRKSDY